MTFLTVKRWKLLWVEFTAELFYWSTLHCPGVPNKVARDCNVSLMYTCSVFSPPCEVTAWRLKGLLTAGWHHRYSQLAQTIVFKHGWKVNVAHGEMQHIWWPWMSLFHGCRPWLMFLYPGQIRCNNRSGPLNLWHRLDKEVDVAWSTFY